MSNPSDLSGLAVKVRRELASYDPFRHASDFVDVQTGPEGVEIYGAIRTDTIARNAMHWVLTRLGDVPLVNRMVADNVLETDIARALAADPRTSSARLRIGAYLGKVAVVSQDLSLDRGAVEEVVTGIAGVRQVEFGSMLLPPDASPVATMALTMI